MNKYLVNMVFIIIVLLASCSKGPSVTTANADMIIATINILSVSPDTGLVDGEDTIFTVEIEYSIDYANQAEISIGFNIRELSSFVMVASQIVIGNTGTYTFSETVTAKDWGIDGNFEVLAIISESPHESTWSPIDFDTQVLSF